MKGRLAAASGLRAAAPWVPDQGDGTYRNPVLFADYSDPDAIRGGRSGRPSRPRPTAGSAPRSDFSPARALPKAGGPILIGSASPLDGACV
jgi:hypothetical protein